MDRKEQAVKDMEMVIESITTDIVDYATKNHGENKVSIAVVVGSTFVKSTGDKAVTCIVGAFNDQSGFSMIKKYIEMIENGKEGN